MIRKLLCDSFSDSSNSNSSSSDSDNDNDNLELRRQRKNNRLIQNLLNCDRRNEECWKDGIAYSMKHEFALVPIRWVMGFSELYVFKRVIGSGTYGVVCEAIDKQTNMICACKIVTRSCEYLRELDHVLYLSNINGVLPLERVSFSNERMCMQFELAECTLKDAIKKMSHYNFHIFFEQLEFWFERILRPIIEIHKRHILHRDLKPENIVMIKRDGILYPQIIDFGLSKRIMGDNLMDDQIWYDVVTCCYRSPELWKSSRYKTSISYRKKIYRLYTVTEESWSLGCILYEMLDGSSLFPCESIKTLKYSISSFIASYLGRSYDPFCLVDPKKFTSLFVPERWNIEKLVENALLFRFTGKKASWTNQNLGTGNLISEHIPRSYREIILYKIRKIITILKGLLHPIPHKRMLPNNALILLCKEKDDMQIDSTVKIKFFNDIPMCRIYPRNSLIKFHREAIIHTCRMLFSIANRVQTDPKTFYFGLYLWISVLFDENISWLDHFHFIMLLVCCYELVNDYISNDESSEFISILKHNRRISQFYKVSKSSFCKEYLLTIRQGRIWIYNPGELRYFINLLLRKSNLTPQPQYKRSSSVYFSHHHPTTQSMRSSSFQKKRRDNSINSSQKYDIIFSEPLWDRYWDEKIFYTILEYLDHDFILPHPDIVLLDVIRNFL